jgi:hypothetical protein
MIGQFVSNIFRRPAKGLTCNRKVSHVLAMVLIAIISLCLIRCAPKTQDLTSSWSCFKGNSQRTSLTNAPGPSGVLQLAWKADAGYSVSSSPVIYRDLWHLIAKAARRFSFLKPNTRYSALPRLMIKPSISDHGINISTPSIVKMVNYSGRFPIPARSMSLLLSTAT